MSFKTVGRVTLFHAKPEDSVNPPKYEGYIDTKQGRLAVKLWAEPQPKVTGGEIIKGTVSKQVQD